MRLFWMECKKVLKSVSFWLYVLVLIFICVKDYDETVKSEMGSKDDKTSVFYISANGVYDGDKDVISKEEEQKNMMSGATERLLSCYRENHYEYYPFGYVKEKKLSEEEQSKILSYLMELTGLPKESVKGMAENKDGEDISISGNGAYILEPGKGKENSAGQFVAEPDDWRYVENKASYDIQVSFARFREIMDDVSNMIGKDSYFSWSMLTLYYYGNDMQDTPVTKQQHQEFYEKDHVTGAFARYYCDSISLVILFVPAFVIMELMLKDKRHKMREFIHSHKVASGKIVCFRYVATLCMVMLPVLVLPLKSLITLASYCDRLGVKADLFAFMKYTFAWILPTVMLVMAISLLVTTLTENYCAVLVSGFIWLIGRPSVGKIIGGNYDFFDLIIRHNTLKGYGRMLENIGMLIINRVVISIIAIILIIISTVIFDIKRKGANIFGGQKFFRNYGSKPSLDV